MGRTIDEDFERRNFKFSGETLAEIWLHGTVDQFATVAEYIDPDKSELDAAGIIKKIRNGLIIMFALANISLKLLNVKTLHVVIKCEAHISAFCLSDSFLLQSQSSK